MNENNERLETETKPGKDLYVITACGTPQAIFWAESLVNAINALEIDAGSLGHPERDPAEVREEIEEKQDDWHWYMYDTLTDAKAEWEDWGGLDQWLLSPDGSDIKDAEEVMAQHVPVERANAAKIEILSPTDRLDDDPRNWSIYLEVPVRIDGHDANILVDVGDPPPAHAHQHRRHPYSDDAVARLATRLKMAESVLQSRVHSLIHVAYDGRERQRLRDEWVKSEGESENAV